MRALRFLSFLVFAATVVILQPQLKAWDCPTGCDCQVLTNPECMQWAYFVASCPAIQSCEETYPSWCLEHSQECWEFCDDLGTYPWSTFCQGTGECQFSCFCVPQAC